MPKASWVVAWLMLFAGISVLWGTETVFEYPSALLDAYDADESCWMGMGLGAEYPVAVVPRRWLVGPPPSQFTAVTVPTDHWVHLLFAGEIVATDGNDLEIVESGAAGEQALVFVTDGADQEYALGIAQADGSGSQILSLIEMELPAFAAGFVPRGLRLVALDRGGTAPGFDVGNVRAWVTRECGAAARYPDPPDGAVEVPVDVMLRWTPACGTDQRAVYLGTDGGAVADAAPQSRYDLSDPDANSFEPPTLRLGQTYYWRVAEAGSNDSNSGAPGTLSDVWSFSVTDRVLIDDFEAYRDWDSSLSKSWQTRDRAHAALDAEVFRSCRQALAFRYYYDNYYLGAYSELQHVFDSPQDWTASGIEVLELWLYGSPGNSTSGQMYVAISDGVTEQTVPVASQAALLTTPAWQPSRTALADFTEIDLASVVSIAIGIWRPLDLPQQYGSGTFYLDDISLRPAVCPEEGRRAADLNADCAVDYRDLDQMASEWLRPEAPGGDVTRPVTAPNEPVLWYKFDGDALDSAGSAHGHVEGRPTYPQGKHGRAIYFAAVGDSVSVSQAADVFGRIREAVTISFWQYGDDSTHLNDTICCSDYSYGVSNPSIAVHLGCWRRPGQYRWDCGTPWSMDNRLAGRHARISEWAGRWNHWAFIKDSVAGKMEIYLNGTLYDRRVGTVSPVTGVTSFQIGSGWYGRYDGLLDDFQVYDYALGAEEVAYLASDGTGVLPSPPVGVAAADLDGSGRVDLGDYAILAAQWLDKHLVTARFIAP